VPSPRTIIVPLDGSSFAERALPVASALAERLDAGIVLVTAPWEQDPDDASDYLQQIATETRTRIVETIVDYDRVPIEAITDAARADPDRVVCMATHGRGRFRWAVIGSVAETVVSRSADPVVLVGPRCSAESLRAPRRIVICVDRSPESHSSIPHAIDWAKALHLDIEVALVIHPFDEEDEAYQVVPLGPLADRIAGEGVSAYPVLLRNAHPAGALVDLAEALPAALLAMTTHTRTGLTRFMVGSVTMGVLNSAPCPVLVTRPEDHSATDWRRLAAALARDQATAPRETANDELQRHR
jgi:nucleotide-binding universal stress UspA family protein